METLSALERLREQRRLQSVEFPLSSLLTIYTRSPRSLYLNYFESFKELAEWLSPISKSTYEIKDIPPYFYSYELLELSKILTEHPSKIYQELYSIWETKSWIIDYKTYPIHPC